MRMWGRRRGSFRTTCQRKVSLKSENSNSDLVGRPFRLLLPRFFFLTLSFRFVGACEQCRDLWLGGDRVEHLWGLPWNGWHQLVRLHQDVRRFPAAGPCVQRWGLCLPLMKPSRLPHICCFLGGFFQVGWFTCRAYSPSSTAWTWALTACPSEDWRPLRIAYELKWPLLVLRYKNPARAPSLWLDRFTSPDSPCSQRSRMC